MMELPLDHNFPEPLLEAISPYLTDLTLIPIRRIDDRLVDLEDRKLIIALHQLGYQGLVTNDYHMLKNPNELAAILKTKLSIFAIQGLGHDPIRAAGAILLDLPSVVRATESGRDGVFWLRPRTPSPRAPWDLFKKAAKQLKKNTEELYTEVKVSDEEMSVPILGAITMTPREESS